MIGPNIFAGVKKLDRNRRIALGINPSDVGTLVAIAVVATQGQIFFDGGATMFFGDDVVDLEWKPRKV
jgi:hypothetical protein